MASVWVARLQGKHGFEKLVAIKTILPKLSGDEMFQQMFLDEARISAGIEHASAWIALSARRATALAASSLHCSKPARMRAVKSIAPKPPDA